jgi:hypothetical protein
MSIEKRCGTERILVRPPSHITLRLMFISVNVGVFADLHQNPVYHASLLLTHARTLVPVHAPAAILVPLCVIPDPALPAIQRARWLVTVVRELCHSNARSLRKMMPLCHAEVLVGRSWLVEIISVPWCVMKEVVRRVRSGKWEGVIVEEIVKILVAGKGLRRTARLTVEHCGLGNSSAGTNAEGSWLFDLH